jgi:hypothetical protein
MACAPQLVVVRTPATGPGLVALTGGSSVPAGLAQRAPIVPLAADGVSNTEIVSRVGFRGRR